MSLYRSLDFLVVALLLVGAIVTLKVVRWKIRKEEEREDREAMKRHVNSIEKG